MKFDVKGKIALVTGGNRGIGRVIVQTLLEAGATRVYAAVRDPASVAELVKSSGGRAVAVTLDVTKPETIAAAALVAKDVQLVINNAGVLRISSPFSGDVFDALDFEIDVNVKGLIRVAQAFAPLLAKNGGGAFVQLNSVASLKSFPDFATYCASKAAAYSITQALRDNLSGQGTLVISVHPGPIESDMANSAGLADVAEPPAVVADGIIAALAAGEFHVFPDSMAKSMWQAYENFAKSVIESDMGEG